MKISINRKSFIDAFAIGASMAGKSKVIPILDNAKVVIKGHTCTVSSYDGETAVRKRFDIISADEDGQLCVSNKDLLSILRSIKDDVITMETIGISLVIKHKKGEVSIPIADVDDFPRPNIEKGGQEFTLDSESLYNMLNEGKIFRSNDGLYPALNGMQLYIGEGCFGIFSTDGHTLYNDEKGNDYKGDKVSAILAPNCIEPILNIINGTENTRIIIQERNIQAITDDATVVSRIIEQKYPNARSVIPTNMKIEAVVEKGDLLESVKRASLTSSTSSNIIKFSVDGMNMSIMSEDKDFSKKAHESVICSSNGSITIGINYNNVTNALSVLGKEIHIQFIDPSRATIWKDSEHEKKIILVMPMMLQE